MFSGPRVTILVGPKKKQYSFPKQLLRHYSSFFAAYFSYSTKLEMPEENVNDFEVLVEYIMRSTIPAQKNADTKRTVEGNKATIAQCLNFLECAQRFELGDVSEVLYGPFSKAVSDLACHKRRMDGSSSSRTTKKVPQCGIQGEDIERVYSLCSAGGRLRTLVAQAALSYSGPQALHQWAEQTQNIPEFAAELIAQLATSFARQSWMDPVTKQSRRQ